MLEIVERVDLAGGVPGERQRQLIRSDAATIVAHAAQRHATPFHFDVDASRSGVESVLNQLLDHRSRALDHLAGSDLADELGFEDADRHEGLGPGV